MLSWQIGDIEKDKDGGHPSRPCRDARLTWFMAAALLQYLAVAAGGGWMYMRLQSLEASLGILQDSCIHSAQIKESASSPLDVAASRSNNPPLSGGGGGGADVGSQVDDIMSKSPHSLLRKRFAMLEDRAPLNASHSTDHHSGGAHRSRGRFVPGLSENAAHFELTNASVVPDHFELQPDYSRAEQATVYEMTGLRLGSGRDRWYPKVGMYLSSGGQPGKGVPLMYNSRAAWSPGGDLAAASFTARGEMKVHQDGVYLFYAQIGFWETRGNKGFSVQKTSEDDNSHSSVLTCEHRQPDSNSSYLSTCSAITVQRLTTRDRLAIYVLGQRKIVLRTDLSFVGLVRIA